MSIVFFSGLTYTHGLGRIAQHGPSGGEYFLGDALGSVRQPVGGAGTLKLSGGRIES